MAGTPVGKVECYHTNTGANGNQEAFKNLYDFFNSQMVGAGYATRIALQYGSSGTGTDYHDGANPFGENAFALFRMDGLNSGNSSSARNGSTLPDFDYYVLMQWADTDSFGTSPGNPGLADAASAIDGVAISVAVRTDGNSPWNGSTNNNGTDTKGSAVWTAGASVVHILPISNSFTGGTHLTNKENMRLLADISSTTRVSMIGTADSFIILVDAGAAGAYVAHYFGIYTPRSGLSPSLPITGVSPSIATGLPWADGTGTTWGTTTGGGTNEGGVLGTLLTDLMGGVSVGQDVVGVFGLQPNNELATPEYDAFPIRAIQRGTGRTGYVGDLETGLVESVYNVPTNSSNAALSRAYFGSATQGSLHLAVAWGGATSPGTGATRAGVTF